MRANITGRTPNPNKPEARRGRVLFVNADAEYLAGRAQNHLRPEDIEKIVSTFERYGEVENYSRIVAFDEIADSANDFNLNVRRYVDNSPPPEPHDVRAHLAGGIPVAEIEANKALFEALGFSPDALFARRPDDDRYRDFKPGIAERPAISRLIEADAGLLARTRSLREALTSWWETHTDSLIALQQGRNLNAVRSEFLRGFAEALLPLAFVDLPTHIDGFLLNAEENNFLSFLESLDKAQTDPESPYSVTVNIEIKFTRSKAKDALIAQLTTDPNAPAVRLTEEQIREKYPWDYQELTGACAKRYSDFKQDKTHHIIRKRLLGDPRFGAIRFLDPGNPKSAKKPFFNPNILNELDKHYAKKAATRRENAS